MKKSCYQYMKQNAKEEKELSPKKVRCNPIKHKEKTHLTIQEVIRQKRIELWEPTCNNPKPIYNTPTI